MHGRGGTGRSASAVLIAAVVATVIATASARVEAQTTEGAAPQVIYVQQPAPSQVYVQPQASYGPPPPAARRSPGPNVGLIVSGAVMLGVGWIVNFIVGLPAGDDPFHSGAEPEWEGFRVASLVPIAGPFIQLGVKPTGFTEDYWAVWLIIDGLLQLAGTGMLIGGLATSDGGDDGLARRDGDVHLSVLPTAGPGHAGLALTGTF